MSNPCSHMLVRVCLSPQLGLCIGRASASVLNLNCSLVLLPVCRSLLRLIRGTHTVRVRLSVCRRAGWPSESCTSWMEDDADVMSVC